MDSSAFTKQNLGGGGGRREDEAGNSREATMNSVIDIRSLKHKVTSRI